MNDQKSETPRTDTQNKLCGWPSFYFDFARELERELTAANQALAASIEERRVLAELFTTKLAESQSKIAHLEDHLKCALNWEHRADQLQKELNESQQREAGLREALSNVSEVIADTIPTQHSLESCLCSECKPKTEIIDSISKALTSPPPSVVPWAEVEKAVALLNKSFETGWETYAREAFDLLLTYAPQPKENNQ